MRNRYTAASFATLFAASLLMVRSASAQHGHGSSHSSGHRGGHSGGHAQGGAHVGGHSGGRTLSAPFQNSTRRGVVARHGASSVRALHHDALIVRHGLHVGMGVGMRRYHDARYAHGYSFYGVPHLGFGFGNPYAYRADYRYANARTVRTIDTTQPSALRVVGPGVVSDADSLLVEEISATIVRVSWWSDGRPVEEVGLFLADTAENVLAVQTIRAAPFTALFEPDDAVAFIGLTVVWPNGRRSTTLLPFRVPEAR